MSISFYTLLPWTLTYACYLFLDELQFHVLDFDPDQQEVDLPNNHVFKVVSNKNAHQEKPLKPVFFGFGVYWGSNEDFNRQGKAILILLGFIVFKLNMQTVFYSDLHLDRVVDIWVGG